MARISTYAIDGTLASSDKLIGTDSSGTITKNYPLGSVSDWLKESGASAVLGQNNYTFQITADPDTGRLPGTISFDNYGGDGTAFSNITTFRLSKISSTGKNVANYLLSTVGDKVILGQLDDLNNFGVYTLVSLTQNSSETGFYDAALLFVEGNGALVGNGIYGLATHSASESAVWGNIEGTVTNQTDLVDYIDAEIAAIPAPATPTLQTVTNAGNTTTNNIGIGASSPTEKLDVAGNIKLRGTNNLTIGSTSSGGNFSLSSGIRGYNFSNNNGDLLRIDSTGNVGIGTTSPSHKLHVVNGSNTLLVTRDVNTAVRIGIGTASPSYALELGAYTDRAIGGVKYLLFQSSSRIDGVNSRMAYKANSGHFFYPTNDNPSYDAYGVAIRHLRDSASNTNDDVLLVEKNDGTDLFNVKSGGDVTTTGNVGIGTTAPGERLHVDGNIRTSSNTGLGVGTDTIYSNSINIKNSGQYRIGNAEFISKSGNDMNIYQGKMRITLAGNVGIGTTAPAEKLEITGYAKASTGFKLGNYGLLYISDNNVNLKNTAYYHINFHTNNAQRMRITNAGNVGIGTSSPSQKLEVAGNVIINDSGSGKVYLGDTNNYLGIISSNLYSVSSGQTIFYTNSAERMRITTAGNVGIGTTSPGSKLTVVGRVDFQNDLRLRGTDSAANQGVTRLFVDNSNKLHIDTANDGNNLFVIDSSGNVGIGTTSPGKTLDIAGEIRTSGRATFNEYVNTSLVYGNIDLNLGYAGGTSGIFIKGSGALAGNVGIGTTSPGELLHVAGTNAGITIEGTTSSRTYYNRSGGYIWSTGLRAGDTKFHIFDERSSDRFVIDDSGNVGIGTTSPSYKLDISTTNGTSPLRLEDTSTSYKSFSVDYSSAFITTLKFGLLGRLSYDGNGGVMNIINASSQSGTSSTRFIMGGNEKMRITNTGNVGIGTTSPSGHLHVIDSGNLSSGGVYIQNTSTTSATLRLENTQGSSRLFTNNGITTLRNTRSGFSDYSVNIGAYGVKIKEGNGGLNSHASAILDLDSTTQGVLFPRMTELQKDSISSPATGLIIYQTDAQEGLYIYKSSGWTQII